jgi:hypothetical protein
MKNRFPFAALVAAALIGTFGVIGCAEQQAAGHNGTGNWAERHFTVNSAGSDEPSDWHEHVVVIDGCEYLFYGWGNNEKLTHKGNCSNPIHYQNRPSESPSPAASAAPKCQCGKVQ